MGDEEEIVDDGLDAENIEEEEIYDPDQEDLFAEPEIFDDETDVRPDFLEELSEEDDYD